MKNWHPFVVIFLNLSKSGKIFFFFLQQFKEEGLKWIFKISFYFGLDFCLAKECEIDCLVLRGCPHTQAISTLQDCIHCFVPEVDQKGNADEIKHFFFLWTRMSLYLCMPPRIKMTLCQILPGGRLDKYLHFFVKLWYELV